MILFVTFDYNVLNYFIQEKRIVARLKNFQKLLRFLSLFAVGAMLVLGITVIGRVLLPQIFENDDSKIKLSKLKENSFFEIDSLPKINLTPNSLGDLENINSNFLFESNEEIFFVAKTKEDVRILNLTEDGLNEYLVLPKTSQQIKVFKNKAIVYVDNNKELFSITKNSGANKIIEFDHSIKDYFYDSEQKIFFAFLSKTSSEMHLVAFRGNEFFLNKILDSFKNPVILNANSDYLFFQDEKTCYVFDFKKQDFLKKECYKIQKNSKKILFSSNFSSILEKDIEGEVKIFEDLNEGKILNFEKSFLYSLNSFFNDLLFYKKYVKTQNLYYLFDSLNYFNIKTLSKEKLNLPFLDSEITDSFLFKEFVYLIINQSLGAKLVKILQNPVSYPSDFWELNLTHFLELSRIKEDYFFN